MKPQPKLQVIQTIPVPSCPECGSKMILRRPNEKQDWEAFWGCNRFPVCKGTIEILPNGKPDYYPLWG